MKNTFTTSLLFFALLCGAVCSAHSCNHDDLKIAPIHMQASPASLEIEDFFGIGTSTPKTYQPLRITPEYSGIAHLSGKQQKFVKDILLPRAIEQLTSVLSIIRESDTIYLTESRCGSAKVPSQYIRRDLDTDLMIFVVAEEQDPGILAAAAACFMHPSTSRPVAGAVYLNTVNLFTDVDTWKGQVETMVHELIHVLGFSSSLFDYYRIKGTVTKDVVRRRMPTKMIVTPKVVQVAREYYNCPTLDGVELENEGGAGSRGSHWERRTLGDEAMTASDVSFPKLSIFTLALLEDSGWYKANYSRAEQMTFGRGRGCAFITQPCIDMFTKQPNFPEFCAVDRQESCSVDHLEVGTCLMNYRYDLPFAFDYFGNGLSGWDSYADGCPTLLPKKNTGCTTSSSRVSGIKGAESRCFDIAHFSTYERQKCMIHRCVSNYNGTTTLTFEADGYLYECPQAGGTVYIPARIKPMSIYCPPADKICKDEFRMVPVEEVEERGFFGSIWDSITGVYYDIVGRS